METTLLERIRKCISVNPNVDYSNFLIFHEKKEYRQAYLVLVELLNNPEASTETKKLIEEYWWKFAN